MFHNDDAIRQFFRVLLGEAVLILIMLGAYAILGRFSLKVVWGAVAGGTVAMGNFLALSAVVSRAADYAQRTGDAQKATLMVRGSAPVRLLVMAAVLIVLLRFGSLEPLATILPLVFVQLSITLTEYFRKDKNKDGGQKE